MGIFDEYKGSSNLNKRDKSEIWEIAIGLKSVGAAIPSEVLAEIAREHIEGIIPIAEVKRRIYDYLVEQAQLDSGSADRGKQTEISSSEVMQALDQDPTKPLPTRKTIEIKQQSHARQTQSAQKQSEQSHEIKQNQRFVSKDEECEKGQSIEQSEAGKEGIAGMDADVFTIYTLIKQDVYLTATKISEMLGISVSTAKRRIKYLKDFGIIQRIGSDKNGYWKVFGRLGN